MLVMDHLWPYGSTLPTTYFNISLVLSLHSCNLAPQQTAEDNFIEEVVRDDSYGDFLSYFNEASLWLFGDAQRRDELGQLVDSDRCEDIIHIKSQNSISAASLLQSFIIILILFCLAVVVFCEVLTRVKRRKNNLTQFVSNSKEEVGEDEKADESKDKTEAKIIELETVRGSLEAVTNVVAKPDSERSLSIDTRANMPIVMSVIHNASQSSISIKLDTTQFLTCTTDHFLSQLDWMLGLTNSASPDQPSSALEEPMSSMAASLVTPRLQRKGIARRPRWRNLASLPLGMTGSTTVNDKSCVRLWQKVEEMKQRMAWSQPDTAQLDVGAVRDNRLSAVLQFHQQTCPVSPEQWDASCLIVNYILTLLELEFRADCTPSSRDFLKVVEFCSFGSAANGTCISAANRFDVMLVMQLRSCSEVSVYHCEACDEVPVGRVVLGMKETSGGAGRVSGGLLRKDRIGDVFGTFLSHKAVVTSTQTLISNVLERLKLKNKFLLDRLSFSLHLDQFEELLLVIETKMLNGLGLGVSKVFIKLIPSFRVSNQDSDPLPSLYAVSPWHTKSRESPYSVRNKIQSRVMRNRQQGIPEDLVWQLECSELMRSFMAFTDRRLSTAGVAGCQVMCQQILRSLFSRSGKDTLLTVGELHPHVLDTVVFFLLLESPAAAWDLSCLPDRLSDCVHFLRSAVQSAWMPGFVIHNPHLIRQMPALRFLPLIMASRQENILANLGPDAVETALGFLESRLQETGLRRCLKEEYSTEMWEYEFFIFG